MDTVFQRGRARLVVLAGSALVLAALLVAALTYYFYCPCERTPGGYLLGEEVTGPIGDWSFVNDVPLCQIEVAGWLRHSVNLNCMAVKGELFLSCASCDGKRWSTLALANPNARIRIDRKVYPVTLARVTDAATLDAAWRARAAKFGRAASGPPAQGWWSFHAMSR